MSSVVDFRPVETGATKLTLVTASQRIMREWMPYLSAPEFVVLMQLVDRTIGWGKTRAAISAERILHGDNAEPQVYHGVNLSRATLFRCLDSMEKRGMIARHPHPKGMEIRVFSVNFGWTPAMLSLPKRLKNPSQAETTPSHSETTPSQNEPRENEEVDNEEGEKEEDCVSASLRPVPGGLDLVRAQVSAATAASRAARTQKTQNLPDRVAGIEAAFRTAFEETQTEGMAAVWSVREKAQVKAKVKGWIAKDGAMTEFVDWAVRNWAAIISKQFRWMTKSPAPKVPEIGFLLSFMGQFLECRAEGKLDKWLASPERTDFEKLTARGLSPEEAAAEIGKSRAIGEMRDENERVRIEARARHRRAEIIEKRTEATATMPIHPDSPAARRARAAASAAARPAPTAPAEGEATIPALKPFE